MNLSVWSIFWFVVLGVVVPAVFVVLAFRSPTRRQVGRWAVACGVTITTSNELLVRAHLGRVRRYRAVAALPFWWLYPAPLLFGAGFPRALASPTPALFAYVTGALVAELTVSPADTSVIKQASLTPRMARDYEPSWIRVLPWVLLLTATSVLVIGAEVAPLDQFLNAIVTLGVGVIVAALSVHVARRIVRRPQRSGDTNVLAADDALRATAISMTASVALLAGLTAVTGAFNAVVPSPPTGGWVVLAVGVPMCTASMGFAALVCIVRQETWGYRRRHPQPVMARAA